MDDCGSRRNRNRGSGLTVLRAVSPKKLIHALNSARVRICRVLRHLERVQQRAHIDKRSVVPARQIPVKGELPFEVVDARRQMIATIVNHYHTTFVHFVHDGRPWATFIIRLQTHWYTAVSRSRTPPHPLVCCGAAQVSVTEGEAAAHPADS
jgi:hypothetical protein